MTQRIKGRLAKLETVIKAPSIQELSTDERAVLVMLMFQRRILPDWLRRAEAWQAAGRLSCPQPSPDADGWDSARWERLFHSLCAANARVGELITQGRHENIIERLRLWGHWQEPYPPPPDVATIMERLERVFPRGAN